MRLVHATKAIVDGPWTAHLPREYSMPGMARRVESLAVEAAQERLSSIAANVPKDIRVTTNVVVDSVQDGIISDAVANRASFILTATSRLTGSSMFHVFSEALSVASNSPIPVMVCNEHTPENVFEKANLKILLTDDLESHSSAAINGTYELVEALPGSYVNHLHVHGGLFDNISDSVTEFLAKAWKNINPKNPEAEDVLAKEFENRRQVLEERGRPLEELVGKEGGYFNRTIATGKISEEIINQAEIFQADIVVMGRHKTLHRKPFSIGRVPVESIAGQNRMILICP
jgi:nucleotide-binding universal stress UspA family protein